MSNSFRSKLSDLSTVLVEAMLSAARSAPLDDLIADPRAGSEPPHRQPGATRPSKPSEQPSPQAAGDTAKLLNLVVLLLRGQRDGLRAEQIRRKLGVGKEDMSRVLKQGLATKKISRKGERRATTYFAAIG